MGKTYLNVRPIPAGDIPAGRVVKESNARRFFRALKKLAHHKARRQAARSLRLAANEEAI